MGEAMPIDGAAAEADEARLASMQAGRRLARGGMRHLSDAYGFACLEEFRPAAGLRVDVAALGAKGELWVVECKSCRADFVGDGKWRGYLEWCDRYFWAVDADFPVELLPEGTGIILADAWGAEIVRPAPEAKLAAPRRRKIVQDFARCAAGRWARAAAARISSAISSASSGSKSIGTSMPRPST
jgi:hypothetical protein